MRISMSPVVVGAFFAVGTIHSALVATSTTSSANTGDSSATLLVAGLVLLIGSSWASRCSTRGTVRSSHRSRDW